MRPDDTCRCCGSDMQRSDHCPECFCEWGDESKTCPDRDPDVWDRVDVFSWDVYVPVY